MATNYVETVLERNLTPDQLEAARDDAREVLCLACAGSGKSRTLAYRIARLLALGADPASIVAFTFTNKAAESIKRQVALALSATGMEPTVLGAMFIGTIHSYCQEVLGYMDAQYRQFDVLDENRLKLYLISRYSELGLHTVKAARSARYFEVIREVSNAWKTMNEEMVDIAEVAANDPVIGLALENVARGLQRDQYIDFSLMVRRVVEALTNEEDGALRATRELSHLMVDEYQDVNPSQEALIRCLHRRSSTLFVVGDDDQAIYAWRGADVSNILTFSSRYPECSRHTLSFNFRSTIPIVRAANDFAAVELGAVRIDKAPDAQNPSGPRDFRNLWFDNRAEEAVWVAARIEALLGTEYQERDGTVRGLTPGDFAILMRSTAQDEQSGLPRQAAFTGALDTAGIKYTLEAGGSVFARPQVSALRDTFELLRGGSPNRTIAQAHFDSVVTPAFPNADFDTFAGVLSEWGRLIHAPAGGPRRRVYPQQLVHDMFAAFGVERSGFDDGTMRDIGVFSTMIQDVEAVYISIDSASRFGEVLNFLQNVAESGYDTETDDVTARPDAVTVSTVHKMKGLEFPVVFIVDVEAQRFPKNRRRYSGWLPVSTIGGALSRGAYQSTPSEEARLFYTAITRAERYLYVSGSESLPGGKQPRKRSPFALRLSHPEIQSDKTALPAGLVPAEPRRRVDETIMPTTFSDIRYFLRCPRDYQLRNRFGFRPPIGEMFGYGQTVHTAVAKLHEVYDDRTPTPDEAERLARDTFHLKHVPPSRDPVGSPGPYEAAQNSAGSIAKTYVETYGEDFAARRQVEARFEVPVSQALISGSIDLIVSKDDRGEIVDASVIDFKTIEGGNDPADGDRLAWPELALQVQLYAMAAREVLGERTRTGAVHLLRDNQRVDVPVGEGAVEAAKANVEWAVDRILDGDFPARPHKDKCDSCDWRKSCLKVPQEFKSAQTPPPIHVPGQQGTQAVEAFSKFDADFAATD